MPSDSTPIRTPAGDDEEDDVSFQQFFDELPTQRHRNTLMRIINERIADEDAGRLPTPTNLTGFETTTVSTVPPVVSEVVKSVQKASATHYPLKFDASLSHDQNWQAMACHFGTSHKTVKSIMCSFCHVHYLHGSLQQHLPGWKKFAKEIMSMVRNAFPTIDTLDYVFVDEDGKYHKTTS